MNGNSLRCWVFLFFSLLTVQLSEQIKMIVEVVNIPPHPQRQRLVDPVATSCRQESLRHAYILKAATGVGGLGFNAGECVDFWSVLSEPSGGNSLLFFLSVEFLSGDPDQRKGREKEEWGEKSVHPPRMRFVAL